MSHAQSDTSTINKKRLHTVLIASGALYGATLVALSHAWYSQQEQSSFHFFNDCKQWNAIDKMGHAYNAYQLSRVGTEMFLWTGMPDRKATIYGSVMSQAMMLPIEVLDGFSSEFGFSWCDVAFNVAGAGLFLSQELLWQKQLIKLKLSFHTTGYAAMRPAVLGKNPLEQVLKDYNGHTFWLSLDMHGMLGAKNRFPKWLNPAIGYGAEGMVYGRALENSMNGFTSQRQFYLSVDLDLSYIKTRSKAVKAIIFFLDMVKLPAPAFEYNSEKGGQWHWFYF
jgi:uncharacterized protein YfiM (DUF2279 family)